MACEFMGSVHWDTVFLFITKIDQSKTTNGYTFNTLLIMMAKCLRQTASQGQHAVDDKIVTAHLYLKHEYFL